VGLCKIRYYQQKRSPKEQIIERRARQSRQTVVGTSVACQRVKKGAESGEELMAPLEKTSNLKDGKREEAQDKEGHWNTGRAPKDEKRGKKSVIKT